jgi:hypothetical protein
MIQLITQYAGFGMFAEIALALFFLAFMMILVSTFMRPKSQMEHFARIALTEEVGAAEITTESAAVTPKTDAEHGATHHE